MAFSGRAIAETQFTTMGVLPAPTPMGVIPLPSPRPTVFPGVVIHPPGVVPVVGVVIKLPDNERPVMSADLFYSDEEADSGTTSSAGSLTMNAVGERVTSFLFTREIRPDCPPGAMCPMFIALQKTRFRVIRTIQEECGSMRYDAVAEPMAPPMQATLAGTMPFRSAPQRLILTDYHESDCSDADLDWQVVVSQGYSKTIYYGEPTTVESNSP